jgi:hypothetical protein
MNRSFYQMSLMLEAQKRLGVNPFEVGDKVYPKHNPRMHGTVVRLFGNNVVYVTFDAPNVKIGYDVAELGRVPSSDQSLTPIER